MLLRSAGSVVIAPNFAPDTGNLCLSFLSVLLQVC